MTNRVFVSKKYNFSMMFTRVKQYLYSEDSTSSKKNSVIDLINLLSDFSKFSSSENCFKWIDSQDGIKSDEKEVYKANWEYLVTEINALNDLLFRLRELEGAILKEKSEEKTKEFLDLKQEAIHLFENLSNSEQFDSIQKMVSGVNESTKDAISKILNLYSDISDEDDLEDVIDEFEEFGLSDTQFFFPVDNSKLMETYIQFSAHELNEFFYEYVGKKIRFVESNEVVIGKGSVNFLPFDDDLLQKFYRSFKGGKFKEGAVDSALMQSLMDFKLVRLKEKYHKSIGKIDLSLVNNIGGIVLSEIELTTELTKLSDDIVFYKKILDESKGLNDKDKLLLERAIEKLEYTFLMRDIKHDSPETINQSISEMSSKFNEIQKEISHITNNSGVERNPTIAYTVYTPSQLTATKALQLELIDYLKNEIKYPEHLFEYLLEKRNELIVTIKMKNIENNITVNDKAILNSIEHKLKSMRESYSTHVWMRGLNDQFNSKLSDKLEQRIERKISSNSTDRISIINREKRSDSSATIGRTFSNEEPVSSSARKRSSKLNDKDLNTARRSSIIKRIQIEQNEYLGKLQETLAKLSDTPKSKIIFIENVLKELNFLKQLGECSSQDTSRVHNINLELLVSSLNDIKSKISIIEDKSNESKNENMNDYAYFFRNLNFINSGRDLKELVNADMEPKYLNEYVEKIIKSGLGSIEVNKFLEKESTKKSLFSRKNKKNEEILHSLSINSQLRALKVVDNFMGELNDAVGKSSLDAYLELLKTEHPNDKSNYSTKDIMKDANDLIEAIKGELKDKVIGLIEPEYNQYQYQKAFLRHADRLLDLTLQRVRNDKSISKDECLLYLRKVESAQKEIKSLSSNLKQKGKTLKGKNKLTKALFEITDGHQDRDFYNSMFNRNLRNSGETVTKVVEQYKENYDVKAAVKTVKAAKND